MKIKWKLSLLVGTTIFLVFSITIWVIHHHSTHTLTNLAYQLAEETAHKNALLVQNRFDKLLERSKTLKTFLLELFKQKNFDRNLINEVLLNMTKENKDILGAWTLWEPNAFDGQDAAFANTPGHDATGRVNYYWHWEGDQLVKEPCVEWDVSDYYQIPKKTHQATLLDPYFYKVSGKEMLLSSVIIPILYQDQFLGVAGIDYLPSQLQTEIAQIRVLEGYSALIGNSGVIVAHRENKYVGKLITEIEPNLATKEAIHHGQSYFTLAYSPFLKKEVYQVFIPIRVGNTTTPWSLMVAVPSLAVLEPIYQLTQYTVIVGTAAIMVSFLMLFGFIHRLLAPISEMSNTLTHWVTNGLNLASVHTIEVKLTDEVGQLAHAFNELFTKLHQEFTERVQVETALRRNEKLFHAILDNLHAFVYLRTLEYSIKYANRCFRELFGHPGQEPCYQMVAQKGTPCEHCTMLDRFHLQKDGEIMTPDGHIYQIHSYPFHDEEHLLILVMGFDMTERQHAEKALQKSEERFDLAMQATSDGLWDYDPQSNTAYFAPHLKEMFGYAATEEWGINEFFQSVHSQDLDKLMKSLSAFMQRERQHYDFTYRIKHKQGHWVWTRARAVGIWDEQGNIVRMVGTNTDVTSQKQAEEALSHQKELLHSVIDNIPMLIFWKDLHSVYLGCNQYLVQKTGLSCTEEIIGKTDFDFSWKQWAEFYRADDQQVMEADQPKLGIVEQMQNQNGTVTWIETNKIPLHDAKGRVMGILGTSQDITARKQAEKLLKEYNQQLEREVAQRTEALRKKEEQWSHFFKLPFIGMAQTSPTKGWLQVNDKICDMFGYSREELMRLTWEELTYPEDLSTDMALFTQVLAGKINSYSLDKRFVRKEGKVICTSLFINAVRDTLGEIDYIVAALLDITERKQAEEALRHSEERFELAMRGATDGLWDWNLKTQEVYYSPRWCEMLGYPKENILPNLDTFTQFLHPEDKEHVFSQVNDYLTGQSSIYAIEFRMRHQQGHYVWILSRGVGVKNQQGEFIRIVGTHVDITERRQSEEALRQSEARFRSLIAATSQIVWTTTATGQIVTEQPGWTHFTGLSFRELQRGKLVKMIHPDDQSYTILAWGKALHTHQFYEIEHRIRRHDGVYRYMRGRGVPMLNAAGQVCEWVGIHEDITDRKEAEIVLQQAKEAAEVANRAKSAFLANMSHELRTPLNGILGYAQIFARDKTLTPKQQEGIAIIQRSGEYLLTLINDILDLSKIEMAKVELYPVDIDFHKFLQDITDLFEIRAQQKGIAFRFEALSYLPLGIRVDEKRLRQILFNLLGNAIKFTDTGGVSFKVGLHKGKIRFQIEDTGPGIDAADLEKIFLPFHQVGNSQHKAEGTGLGLSITKKLVEMMGGTLHVESQVGQGSIFWTAFEFLEISELIKHTTPITPTIIGVEGPSRKILVIDDKWENRSVMTNLLSPLGFEIIEATNGQEGLEQTKKHHPDLILIDLVMPVMDGFEATRQIRRIPRFEQLPIIAASASVFDYHQQESQSAGCTDFIAKPFRAEILLELLREHLHLTWIYETEMITEKTIQETSIPESEPIEKEVIPSPEEVGTLFDLAMKGDIGGLLEVLNELEHATPQLKGFNDKLRRLAKNFDEEQICHILENCTIQG